MICRMCGEDKPTTDFPRGIYCVSCRESGQPLRTLVDVDSRRRRTEEERQQTVEKCKRRHIREMDAALQVFESFDFSLYNSKQIMLLLQGMAANKVYRLYWGGDIRADFDKIKETVYPITGETKCFCCKGQAHHRHHLIQLSRGGDNEARNIVYLCRRCHADIHTWMSVKLEGTAETNEPELTATEG